MTIIGYEGLIGSVGQWLHRGLLSHIKGHTVQWRGWLAWGRPRCNVVIGHSFGCLAASQTEADVCILIDPVVPPFGFGRLRAKAGVHTICIYQRRSMPAGHGVLGAENIEITDGTGHTALPAHPEVMRALLRYVSWN